MTWEERVRGCWVGKAIGAALGRSVRGLSDTREISFFEPVPPPDAPRRELEVPLVWLDLAERSSGLLSPADFARARMGHLHRMDDAHGWCRWNLRRGVSPEAAGTFENPFASDDGGLARAEFWAMAFPGDPASAAAYAFLDASQDHGPEGVAGAVFLAVLLSHVAGGDSLREAAGFALANIPAESETGRAVEMVADYHRLGVPPADARKDLLAYHGSDNDAHGPLNAALAAWALLYGAGEFGESVVLAANGGRDPETVAGAVGAVLGAAAGAVGIPPRWKEAIGVGSRFVVGPGVRGIEAPPDLLVFSRRAAALAGRLEARGWSALDWERAAPAPALARLPGTVRLAPFAVGKPVAWANGELPPAAKASGGGDWEWTKHDTARYRVVCLSPGGGRLLLDGKPVVTCPPGLPFVPAPHRCAPAARAWLDLPAGKYRMRVELNASDARQSAAVVLASADGHVAPWSGGELPGRSELPDLD